MVNELDEMSGPVNSDGRDVNVIEKQLAAEVTGATKYFDQLLLAGGVLLIGSAGFASTGDFRGIIAGLLLGLAPFLIFQVMKKNAESYLRKLVQRIQANASQIDNYLEQRVQILQNLAKLLDKSIDLDKDVMKSVAAYRGGSNPNSDASRNETSAKLDGMFSRINLAFEAYPNLKAQDNIEEAMRQNSYLQKEITAARTLYNDSVATWNQQIFSWPTKLIVAAKSGFTTRIPFTASAETKAAARGTFF